MDLIIGAGITGLSYAAFCGHTDYLLLEQSTEIGGYCKTTRRNGYVWDYSGHFFHFTDPLIKDIVMGGMDKASLVEVTKNTAIHYHDRRIDYPFQKNIHQLAKQEFIDCLYDLFTTSAEDYATFKEMLYVKFGQAIADKFLIPYNTKLYACDLDTLDKDAMGRFFPYAEKEEIVRNFKQEHDSSYNATFVYPLEGAIAYIHSMMRHVKKEQVRLNCSVKSIDLQRQIVVTNSGEIIHYDRLVSTIPFPRLLQLANIAYDKTIYNWNKVLVFNLGFDTGGNDNQTHWLYFPEEKYCFYRVGFYSNILSSEKLSLYVELGFKKDEAIVPEDWLNIVLHDLKQAGIVSEAQQLVDYESIVMNPAYVHINAASVADVAHRKDVLAENGVYSIGRYGSWTYCSIEDNVKEAKALAQQLNP
ncbi:MAG: NAD(P)-binding protein [Bacteroidales bacterium]|nr:NAD(P)-binding protein [Bacteroidales bacterium]